MQPGLSIGPAAKQREAPIKPHVLPVKDIGVAKKSVRRDGHPGEFSLAVCAGERLIGAIERLDDLLRAIAPG
ncbi:hypothetical protein [Vreelandella populi]|uniref:hypothetical protein n=1 Tax=Vreelandella populi TaxID=2498858 RepID=UPI0028A8E184|nr:hypothetical protein [Halomonas populi]